MLPTHLLYLQNKLPGVYFKAIGLTTNYQTILGVSNKKQKQNKKLGVVKDQENTEGKGLGIKKYPNQGLFISSDLSCQTVIANYF